MDVITWFKVDDDLAFHRKVVAAGNAAMGLWVRAGSWSAQHLTDGFIPEDMVGIMGTTSQRSKLIKAGLWIEVDGGCLFHQWNENGRQPTSKSVREKRAAAAERQAKHRNQIYRNSQVSESSNAVTDASVTESVTPLLTPTPTRPDPVSPSGDTPTTSATADAAPLMEIPPSAVVDHDAEFETWWKVWPRKDSKADAKKAYKAARRKKVSADQLLTAATEQLAAWKAEGKDPKFIPYGASWLRGERYNDEIQRPKFTVITNSASPWAGTRIPTGQSPWAEDMGWSG